MEARAYVHGKALPLSGVSNPGSVILEVELPDGRTVQMRVTDEGEVNLRAWGNIPEKVGNMDQFSFHGQLSPQRDWK